MQSLGQAVVLGGHAFAQVEEAGHGEAALESLVQFLGRHVPAGDGVEEFQGFRVVVVEELAEADGVADGGALEAGAGVVAAGGGDWVVVAHVLHGARVVHGDFQALDVDDVVLGITADGAGGAEGAFGQQVADTVAVGNLLDQVEKVLGRAELKGLAVFVEVAQAAHFVHLHGPGDGGAGGDAVHAQVVEHFVALADGHDVGDAGVGADGSQGFVLGAAVLGPHLDFGRVDLHALLAAHGAGEAAVHVVNDLVAHGDGVDVAGPVQLSVAEVVDDQMAFKLLGADRGASAPGVQAVVRPAFAECFAGDPPGGVLDRFAVSHLHPTAAANGNGLEVLGAHDRAEAGAAGDFVQVVDDAGVADKVFAGGPNLGNPDLLVAEFLADGGFHRTGDLAPELGGVAELDLVVLDPEVNGLGCAALDDDAVPAGLLELGAPVAAGLGLAEKAGERRLGAHAVAAGARQGHAGGGAHGEDQAVDGIEGVGAARRLGEQVVGDEVAAAEVLAEERVAGLLGPAAALSEVHAQDSVLDRGWRHQLAPIPPDIGTRTSSVSPSRSFVSREASTSLTPRVRRRDSSRPWALSRSPTVEPAGTSTTRTRPSPGKKRARSA